MSQPLYVAVRRLCAPVWTRSVSVAAIRSKTFDVTTADQFKNDVLSSKKPVLVDFHAQWCGPCKEMMPALQSVADQHDQSIDLARVDVDVLLEVSMEYNVTAVPTVLVIVDGEVKDTFVGLQGKEFISEFVKKHIK